MASLWIIDGYNFIRQSARFSDLEAYDPKKGKEAALKWLGDFPQKTGELVYVIFDAYSGLHNEMIQQNQFGLKILESRGGYTADEEIMKLASEHRERAIIVTSDREILTHAVKSGSSIISSQEFERELGKVFQRLEEVDEDLPPKNFQKGRAFQPPKEKKKAYLLLRKYQ